MSEIIIDINKELTERLIPGIKIKLFNVNSDEILKSFKEGFKPIYNFEPDSLEPDPRDIRPWQLAHTNLKIEEVKGIINDYLISFDEDGVSLIVRVIIEGKEEEGLYEVYASLIEPIKIIVSE